MNIKLKSQIIVCFGLLMFLVSSCIKQESLDQEANITLFTIEDEGYLNTLFNEQTNQIYLNIEGDISKYKNGIITPKIEVSSNATVSPHSGEPIELKDYMATYTVTAENGGQKTYTISVIQDVPVYQDFERWTQETSNRLTYEVLLDETWKNANEGVSMLYYPDRPFPTRSTKEDVRPGSSGSTSLLLETVEGKRSKFLGLMDIPVYAGNMFRGVFSVVNALSDPLGTARFGQPHPVNLGKPVALVAYYKYTSGTPFLSYEGDVKDIKTVVEDYTRKDRPDVYAVLYKSIKTSDNPDGRLTARNIKTSDQIVATAFMEDKTEKTEWTLLETKFTYYEEIDFDKYDYGLAVCLSSSENGATYQGAIGSKLLIDEVRIVYETDDDAHLYPLDPIRSSDK